MGDSGTTQTDAQSGMWNRFKAGSSSQPKASNPGLRNLRDRASKNNATPENLIHLIWKLSNSSLLLCQEEMATGAALSSAGRACDFPPQLHREGTETLTPSVLHLGWWLLRAGLALGDAHSVPQMTAVCLSVPNLSRAP